MYHCGRGHRRSKIEVQLNAKKAKGGSGGHNITIVTPSAVRNTINNPALKRSTSSSRVKGQDEDPDVILSPGFDSLRQTFDSQGES